MKNEKMSVLDAFIELNDISEDIARPVIRRRKVVEGKLFDVNNSKAMDDAKKFVKKDAKKEPELVVIDVDANTKEDIKSNNEYIGKAILKCKSCGYTHFHNLDELKADENNPDLYNVEDKCPNCNHSGQGFDLKGQAAEFDTNKEENPADESKEAKFENDAAKQLNQEPAVDNDLPTEEPVEETPVEDVVPEEEEETPYDETTAEDDTLDMEDKTGQEVEDDYPWDDTEEEPEPVVEPEEEVEEEIKFEPKKKLHEAVIVDYNLRSFISNHFADCPDMKIVCSESGKTLYEGACEELADEFDTCTITWWAVDGLPLFVNVVSDVSDKEAVYEALEKFVDKESLIHVVDQESGEDVVSGDWTEVIKVAGDFEFVSFDAPEHIVIAVKDCEGIDAKEEESEEAATVEEALTRNIIRACNLKEFKINKFGTEEYYINESINNLEDLKYTFDNYVANKSYALIEEFKAVTGYRTELDLAYDRSLNEGALNQHCSLTQEEAQKQAREILNKNDAYAVIYGIGSGDAFTCLDPIICKDRDQLLDKTEIIELRYHRMGGVDVEYKKTRFSEDSCKSRKELAEKITSFKKDNINYKVSKSNKPGCRYDIKIDSDFDVDTDEFDKNVNEYFTEAYSDGRSYKTNSGYINKDGKIVLEGCLKLKECDQPMTWNLVPNCDLTACDVPSVVFIVTNDCSDEEFEISDIFRDKKCNPYINPEECSDVHVCPECGDEPCTCEPKVCPVCGKEVCECNEAYLGWDQNNDPEEAEYIANARDFCDDISEMGLHEVNTIIDDYEFEEHAPEDDAERMIYHALKERKAELESNESEQLESLNESSGIPAGPQRSEEREEALDKVEKEIDKEVKAAKKVLVPDHVEETFPKLNESLTEAAKKADDELPPDPAAVKTQAHDMIADLVKDEVEAIHGYTDVKAELADTHIEHKDEIIDTLDHIVSDEEEHIDELNGVSDLIPFDKANVEEVHDRVEEPAVEEVPEIEELPVEESVNENLYDALLAYKNKFNNTDDVDESSLDTLKAARAKLDK